MTSNDESSKEKSTEFLEERVISNQVSLWQIIVAVGSTVFIGILAGVGTVVCIIKKKCCSQRHEESAKEEDYCTPYSVEEPIYETPRFLPEPKYTIPDTGLYATAYAMEMCTPKLHHSYESCFANSSPPSISSGNSLSGYCSDTYTEGDLSQGSLGYDVDISHPETYSIESNGT